MQELTLEKRCAELKGQNVTQVIYYGHVQHYAHAHGVTKAIYITTEDKSLYRIGFADEFSLRWGHGITIKKVLRVFPDDDEEQLYDATSDWHSIAGSEIKISDTKIHWRYIADSHSVLWHYYSRTDYPQDIELTLSNGKNFFIGVAKIIDDAQTKLFTNHLTIFFAKDVRDVFYERVIKWQ